MKNLQLDINDVIRLLKDGQAESFQIQKDTCLVLQVEPENFIPALQYDMVNIIQKRILEATGKAMAVFVTFKNSDLEQRTEAELIDMRTKCDLMIAQYAENRLFKRSQN